jgi:uncharacterized protein YbcI
VVDRDHLRGGELNLALTDELVRIQTTYLGRGPRSASTFYHGDTVVTLMHEVLTKAEKILAQKGRGSDVTDVRRLFQQEMEADVRAAVERLTGQKVLALLAGSHIDPDVVAAVFILDAVL